MGTRRVALFFTASDSPSNFFSTDCSSLAVVKTPPNSKTPPTPCLPRLRSRSVSVSVSACVNDRCVWFGAPAQCELFQTPLEVGGPHVSAAQRPLDVLLKQPPVRLQNLRSLFVQRVFGIWLLWGRGRAHRQNRAL